MRTPEPAKAARRPSWLSLSVLFAAAIAASGCGGPERTLLHSASGKIVQANKPATGARVTLHPRASIADASVKSLRPSGVADESGNYILSTYVPNDGAPAGEWIATVVWPDPNVPAARREEIESEGNTVPDLLRSRFAKPEDSPWTVTIVPGDNSLPPIDLSKP